MKQKDSKAVKAIKALNTTVSELSQASNFLSMTISWLMHDETYIERIKPDLGFIESISKKLRNRTEGIFDNVRDKEALNQCDDDEFGVRLSYDLYKKNAAERDHLRELSRAFHQAEEEGHDIAQWAMENTNIVDVMEGKVKKPWQPEPAIIGKILKEWRGDRYSLYAIAKECGCRSEGLQRIEEGKDVTTTNLMHYLHFIKTHEPQSSVIAAIWQVL